MDHKSIDETAVIVPNWNGAIDIITCLGSLTTQSYPLTIVVVDNGSIDNSVDLIEAKFPNIVLLKQPVNLGFAGGVNKGIEYCLSRDFKYIGLFNNDAIADTKWLESLILRMEDNRKIGITTCLFLHRDGLTIDSTGEQYSKWGLPFPRNRNSLVQDTPNKDFTFGATGGATLYRAELFRDIGLFDESFFAYYEDVDMSFRAQLAGWKIAYTPKAIAYHEQGATSKKIPGFTARQTFKNLPLLFWKNVPKELLFPIGIRFFPIFILIYLNAFRRGNGLMATKGLFKSFALFPKALKQRHAIQKNKRVTTSYIKSILWNGLPPSQTGLQKIYRIFSSK